MAPTHGEPWPPFFHGQTGQRKNLRIGTSTLELLLLFLLLLLLLLLFPVIFFVFLSGPSILRFPATGRPGAVVGHLRGLPRQDLQETLQLALHPRHLALRAERRSAA